MVKTNCSERERMDKLLRTIFGFLVTLAAASFLINTVAGYSITGYITDVDTGAYLGDSVVNTSTVIYTTAGDGYYVLTGLSNGTYTVHAYNFNYQINEVPVTIAGSNVEQNITLDPWVFDPATSNITVLDESAYTEFHAAFTSFNWSRSLVALAGPFVSVIGNFFFLILFGLPFIMAWIRQSKVIIPAIWGFTIGGLMLTFLPKEYQGTAVVLLILAFVAVMYGLFKERY
jgi:hypothetical protein